jgi:uncharacterized heparinase superfamily protein
LIYKYFHTIRYLKFSQIYRRIVFNLLKPNINKYIQLDLRNLQNKFFLPISYQSTLLNKDTFKFLNEVKTLQRVGWDGSHTKTKKLWLYNLHYFDDLNAERASERKDWHHKLMQSWVKENIIGKGTGWESYPTSIRIVNWIKWYLSGNIFPEKCLESLAIQSRWLAKRIEWHILGNHLFKNAKALVFAGLFFSGEESDYWLKKGLKIIDKQLSEQILDDGGNFERSPMYHAIFLEDLLDLVNIVQVYKNKKLIKKTKIWTNLINKMFNWLNVMKHPDGEISFFNDSTFGIAPKLKQLSNYAKRLGIYNDLIKLNKVTHLNKSGYLRFSSKNIVTIIDVAPIGPNYLPGHAHADTLSFELSLYGQRLLVNTGISEYGLTSIRKYERSTKAHNTVEVNNENSSEVWHGFRVARRAFPIDLKIDELKNYTKINCAHNGYQRLFGKPIHRRNWQFSKSSLIVNDQIEGFYKNAYAYFHIHPSVNILRKKNDIWSLVMSNGQKIILEIKTGKSQIKQTYYSPEFGKRLKTQCIKVSIDKKVDRSCIKISW